MEPFLIAAPIWAALVMYTVGEWGQASVRSRGGWPRLVWSLGALLYLIHVAAAFQFAHDWSHDAAYAHTAARTGAVVGLDWGGGIWVNYAFTVMWLGAAVWWWIDPRGYRARPRVVAVVIRVLFLFMIVNAAVVFVTGPTRWIGVAIVAALVWCWRVDRSGRRPQA